MDHADCILRHFTRLDGGIDGKAQESKLAWRASALSQDKLERELSLPLPRAARLPAIVADDLEWKSGGPC